MILQSGQIIRIKYSKALLMLDLCELVTRNAVVSAIVKNDEGRDCGVYAFIKTGRLRDKEVYIPIQSVESIEMLNKKKSDKLIKNTIF